MVNDNTPGTCARHRRPIRPAEGRVIQEPRQRLLQRRAKRRGLESITIPASVLDRWNGPAVSASANVIPRNALEGLPLHKVDLHVTKDIRLGGTLRAQLVAEIFNVLGDQEWQSDHRRAVARRPERAARSNQCRRAAITAVVPRRCARQRSRIFTPDSIARVTRGVDTDGTGR
jgi:hypothetical protein